MAPAINAAGTDTNVGIWLQPKGTGSVSIGDGNGNFVFGTANVNSAVNYVRAVNAATGNAPYINATGSDTNIDLNLTTKGTGTVKANGVQLVDASSAQTLANKRVTVRTTAINAPGATPTVATDSYDDISYTGLAAAITSMTTNLTGTPTHGQKLMLTFKDNGTARAITWGASFVSSGTAVLLSTTVANKTHRVGLIYDSGATKWVCVASDAVGY